MKKVTCLIIHSLLSIGILNAQQSWQKISYPATNEIHVNFKTPPPEYQMILWWRWDGPMTGEVSKMEKFVKNEGKVILMLDFEPYETKFIVLSK